MFQPSALQWRILETLRQGLLKGFPLLDSDGDLQPNSYFQCRAGVPRSVLKAALMPTGKAAKRAEFEAELGDALNGLLQRKLLDTQKRKICKARGLRFQRPDGLAVFLREVRDESRGTIDATVGRLRDGKISGTGTTMLDETGTEPVYRLEPAGFDLLDSRVDDGAGEAEAAESSRPGDRCNMSDHQRGAAQRPWHIQPGLERMMPLARAIHRAEQAAIEHGADIANGKSPRHHEAWAVLKQRLERVEELWEQLKLKAAPRSWFTFSQQDRFDRALKDWISKACTTAMHWADWPTYTRSGMWGECRRLAGEAQELEKRLYVLDAEPASATVPEAPPTEKTATHSPEFTSVDWFGTHYTFSKGHQAQAVRVLWEAWKAGNPELGQETIGERIASSAERFELRKVFRRRRATGGYELHPAWGIMIEAAGKGVYRLKPPESARNPQ